VAFGKFLVGFGLLIAAGGLLIWWGVPIGRLPGDIVVRRGSFSFYLPITTSIIVSVALTVLMALFKR
jgi:membrane protein implicated in regulation of membrane protease activity